MANVIFSSELQQFTGEAQFQAAASNYRDLITELLKQYPALEQAKINELAIVIDGVIIPDPLLETFSDNSELHFIPFVAGG